MLPNFMDDQALLRYSRHILLDELGIEGQETLLRSHALVVGAGGLGAAALLYLASAGIGRISVADGDCVDLTNLQRQVIHREDAIGLNKAVSAARTMSAINSTIRIDAVSERLDGPTLSAHVAAADIVLDCSDNFQTRHAINRASVLHRKMLVSGAAIRFDGQITSFDARTPGGPCYQCLFPDTPETNEERCAVMGVFAPLVGIIGAMQAAEAIRLLTGIGQSMSGRLLMLDGRAMVWQCVNFSRDDECEVCSHRQVASERESRHASL